jgi:hypothetical protein
MLSRSNGPMASDVVPSLERIRASIDDLIEMKRRAGRLEDLLDIAELQDLKKRLA